MSHKFWNYTLKIETFGAIFSKFWEVVMSLLFTIHTKFQDNQFSCLRTATFVREQFVLLCNNVLEKNLHQHAMIQFCVKLGYIVTRMYENYRKAFSKSTMSCVTTFWWRKLLTSSKGSVKDEERRGRLTTTKTFENMMQALKKDFRVSWISKTIVQCILQDDLKKESCASALYYTF